jgi:hypothetical protein
MNSVLRCVSHSALLLVLLLTGCRLLDRSTKVPVQAVMTAVPSGKHPKVDPVNLQVGLQRFADDFFSRTANAVNEYALRAGTEAGKRQALAWKLTSSSAVFSIASGPNPTANLIDFIALSMLSRHILEIWARGTNGVAFQPWLEAARVLETNSWKMAEGVLSPEQQRELRNMIETWQQSNASDSAHIAFFERPEQFAAVFQKSTENQKEKGGIITLVGLDPTAGLDPAVREVARTRLFAERAMFTAQRMPILLHWQIELLTYKLLHEDAIAALLTNATTLAGSADRLSRASETVGQTAAQLPDRITAERKAILAALETQQGTLRELSAEVGRTLLAGDKMSSSLNGAITSFDALMKRFGVGEPKSDSSKPRANTNAAPFNILDYARTAEQVMLLTRELDALLKDTGGTLDSPGLNRQLNRLNELVDRTRTEARSLINHIFLLAAGLVLLIFAGLLAYRRLAPREGAVTATTESSKATLR